MADAESLALVVSDMYERQAQAAMELDQLAPQHHAEWIIEVRKRLIQKQHARFMNDRPAQHLALTFASREPRGPPIHQPADPEHVGDGMHSAAAFSAGDPVGLNGQTPGCRRR